MRRNIPAAINSKIPPPQLSRQDAVLIAESYPLWQALGDKVWTGWTEIQMPIIYVTDDYEYAIGFPKAVGGFTELGSNEWLDKPIQARKRVFGTHVSASFPYEGTPTM